MFGSSKGNKEEQAGGQMTKLTDKVDRSKVTDMMKHYLATKDEYEDEILFYRLGDFYELFYDDAILVSKLLDLSLTSKACGQDEPKAPMCGVPFHAAEGYIAKLIKLGYKVAICEQYEVPSAGSKKVVEREVSRVITAGTVTEDSMLDEKANNYIMAVKTGDESIGVAICEMTLGVFKIAELKTKADLDSFIAKEIPAEIIGDEKALQFNELPTIKSGSAPRIRKYLDWAFENPSAREILREQFGPNCFNVYEFKPDSNMALAAGAVMQYMKETQKCSFAHIDKIIKINTSNYMSIDTNTRRNLEIVETIRERKTEGSLLSILDNTCTNMGARLIRTWLSEPLLNEKEINNRLDTVEGLYSRIMLRDNLKTILKSVYDMERIAGKIVMNKFLPRDCKNLRESLRVLPEIKMLLENSGSEKLQAFGAKIDTLPMIFDLLERAINDENLPLLVRDGGVIKQGYNAQLDEYRSVDADCSGWVTKLEQAEKEATGIKNLRISYNRIFGYYIEVSKSQIDQVPIRYMRRQTIANGERYITEELKQLEDKILNARDLGLKLEIELFDEISNVLKEHILTIENDARILAELDCLLSFAQVAAKNNYCKPRVSAKFEHIKIEGGRHPVVEEYLRGEQFISNDTLLDSSDNKIMVITGPNMAGKSTYMRQVAVITLMAHVGCFVPAKTAEIAIVDRIFTRVGASDDLAFGQSTFMVEMSETANILANATNRSLVILDEIGRGTSTFDGLSIAWAVLEYIARDLKCKTLFATHYHELTRFEGKLEGVKNYKVGVKEVGGSIVFLRKISRGGANKSFGVEVASLAGLPEVVISRAREISKGLEKSNLYKDMNELDESSLSPELEQNALEIMGVLKDLQIEKVTPLSALEILNDLATKAKK